MNKRLQQRLRSALAPGMLVLGGLACSAVLLEIGVRRFEPQPAVRYRYSPDTLYEPIPGARFRYRRSEFDIPIEYNADGMRDRERSVRAGKTALRIALLGDSQTEAKEVPFDSTFGQILERSLQSRFPQRNVEVLNFGVSGFGTMASAVRYATLAARFSPQVVVYVFVDNDPEDNLERDAALYSLRDGKLVFARLSEGTPLERHLLDMLKRRTHSYAFLRFRLQQIRDRFQRRAMDTPSGQDVGVEATWSVLGLGLESLRDLVKGQGAQLLVFQTSSSGPAMTRELQDACSRLGLGHYDLTPVFAGEREDLSFEFDGHWRTAGHRIAARELERFLEQSVVLGDSTSSPHAR